MHQNSRPGTLGKPMNRPPAIRVTLVLLALLGLLEALAAIFFALLALIGAPTTKIASFEAALACAVLAVWSFVTLVRVARLRRWGRTSLLILATGLALVGTYGTCFDIYVIAGGIVHRDQPFSIGQGLIPLGLFYLALAATGIGWLVYFSRPATRALFTR